MVQNFAQTFSNLKDKECNYLDNVADNHSVFAPGYRPRTSMDAVKHVVLYGNSHNLCLCPDATCFL